MAIVLGMWGLKESEYWMGGIHYNPLFVLNIPRIGIDWFALLQRKEQTYLSDTVNNGRVERNKRKKKGVLSQQLRDGQGRVKERKDQLDEGSRM